MGSLSSSSMWSSAVMVKSLACIIAVLSMVVAAEPAVYDLVGTGVYCGEEQYRKQDASPEECRAWCTAMDECRAYITYEDSECDKCIAYTSHSCAAEFQIQTSCTGQVKAYNKIAPLATVYDLGAGVITAGAELSAEAALWYTKCHAGVEAHRTTAMKLPSNIPDTVPVYKALWNDFLDMTWLHVTIAVLGTCFLCCGIAAVYIDWRGLLVVKGVAVFVGLALLGFTYFDQCVVGNNGSLLLHIHEMHLDGHPTDTWWFDEHDEIVVTARSGFCSSESPEMKVAAFETKPLDLSVHTYFDFKLSVNLVDKDSGFQGADDLSEPYSISSKQLAVFRRQLTSGVMSHVDIEHTFLVKGGSVWTENRLLGFAAGFLCVSAVDFVLGPWSSKLLKAGKLALNAKKVANTYKRAYKSYEAGKLTKKSIGKQLLAEELRKRAKRSVKQPAKDALKEDALMYLKDQTSVDEYLSQTLSCWDAQKQEWYEEGKDYLSEQGEVGNAAVNMLEIGEAVYEELDNLANAFAELSDAMEFCLTDIGGGNVDAPYHLEMTLTLA